MAGKSSRQRQRTASAARRRRHARVRGKVMGTAARPRLNVYRSLSNIYAQVIDDRAGHTLVAASSLDPALRDDVQGIAKKEVAAKVGTLVAARARAAGISTVVFDRAGYQYHGRVKALAEAAREAGLDF